MSSLHPSISVPTAALDRASADAAPAVRSWRVLHACEHVAPLLPAIESQSAAGMKPFIVTPSGAGHPEDFLLEPTRFTPGSLLTSWNEVRTWRRCLLDCESEARGRGFDLVHAHSFASGMAAVRNCPCVVYDVSRFVEEAASSTGVSSQTSWLGRSFRVAEQFAMTRAGVVVVHGTAIRRGALERGVAEENLFYIPDPLAEAVLEILRGPAPSSCNSKFSDEPGINFLAADFPWHGAEGPLSKELEMLLEAFAHLRAEIPSCKPRLLLPVIPELIGSLLERARALEIVNLVHPIGVTATADAFVEADVIIAGSAHLSNENGTAGRSLSAAARGLIAGRAVLAADCDANRDLSSRGRGLLWYRPDDARDLANRAAFLAANPDLRSALVASGRRMLVETRSPEAVGRAYDRAYQRAWLRRRSGGIASGTATRLEPITAV